MATAALSSSRARSCSSSSAGRLAAALWLQWRVQEVVVSKGGVEGVVQGERVARGSFYRLRGGVRWSGFTVNAEHGLERGRARESRARRQRVGSGVARVMVVGAGSGSR